MSVKNILVPLDLLHGKTDTLLYVQQMAAHGPLSVTLLSVVELSILHPDESIYENLCQEAQFSLAKLSRIFFGHEQATRLCVRPGRPDEEIISEAVASNAELILMSGARPRPWHQFFRSHTVDRVVKNAPCPTLVLPSTWQNPAAPQQTTHAFGKALRHFTPQPRPTWTSLAGT
jgi:nucleotide-binding universal stress UspA family protein